DGFDIAISAVFDDPPTFFAREIGTIVPAVVAGSCPREASDTDPDFDLGLGKRQARAQAHEANSYRDALRPFLHRRFSRLSENLSKREEITMTDCPESILGRPSRKGNFLQKLPSSRSAVQLRQFSCRAARYVSPCEPRVTAGDMDGCRLLAAVVPFVPA